MLALLLACAAERIEPEVRVDLGGVEVVGRDIERVEVVDPQGVPLAAQRAPAALEQMRVSVPWQEGGTHEVIVRDEAGTHSIEVELPHERPVYTIEVQAPLGQAQVEVGDGEVISVPLIGGRPAEVGVFARAWEEVVIETRFGGEDPETHDLRPGERAVLVRALTEEVEVVVGEVGFVLEPTHSSVEDAAALLHVEEVVFPAEPSGHADPARVRDRVALPSHWWRSVLRSTGLGFRPRDEFAVYAWQAVHLRNDGEDAINVVLEARVVDEEGDYAPAFRPRMRAGDDGSGRVRALMRVPPGSSAVGTLPLYVDEDLLGMDEVRSKSWTAEIAVIPLGASEAVTVHRRPIHASRGSSTASLGLLAALVAAVLGTGLLVTRGRRWLQDFQTSELMTIALFGALSFLVGAAGRLLSTGVATLLGPFSPFLTGLVDDAFRYTLIATLLVLLPRVGVASLAVIVSWMLSGLMLGTFQVTDLLFVGGRVFWLEGFLWLAGITRQSGWLDEVPWRRWLRLSFGLGLASAFTSATGVVLMVTLYRLFLADWFVIALVSGPGFLYVVLACLIAVPFADSLRRIQR
ncbi:MAG TPA: hypothetical protein QGF58_09655 [Myxococcota bacterium]|nr:hypothetical protein [Myxococcota bacterium]